MYVFVIHELNIIEIINILIIKTSKLSSVLKVISIGTYKGYILILN